MVTTTAWNEPNVGVIDSQTRVGNQSLFTTQWIFKVPQSAIYIDSKADHVELTINACVTNRVLLRALNKPSEPWERAGYKCMIKSCHGHQPFQAKTQKVLENPDTVVNWSDDLKVLQSRQWIPGGNRLRIAILQPGKYELEIPIDSELNVNVNDGKIFYNVAAKTRPTDFHASASFLNIIGDSGSNCFGKQEWSYYFYRQNHRFVPKTSLKVTTGSIFLEEIQ